MKKFIPYNPKLKPFARKLRQEMTFGEVLLWNELKEDKLLGFDFNRQCCLDEYIVDFYCKELMLAIEIDGQAHNGEEAFTKDEIRQKRLESLGVYFVRFTEADVKYDRLNVLRVIDAAIIELIKQDRDIQLPKDFNLGYWNNWAYIPSLPTLHLTRPSRGRDEKQSAKTPILNSRFPAKPIYSPLSPSPQRLISLWDWF